MRKATAPMSRSGEQHRHRQRQRQLHAERDADDQHVVEEGPVEDRVAEQLDVIAQADESVERPHAVPVEEAVPGGLADRQR